MWARRSYCVLTRTPEGSLKASECLSNGKLPDGNRNTLRGLSSMQAGAARISR